MERNHIKWVNINDFVVLPAIQSKGASAILYTELDNTLKEFGFEHLDIGQVNEANFNNRSYMKL